MLISLLQEPLLDFGTGRHVDIRFGLMNFGPQDLDQVRRPEKIKLGVIGTSQSIEDSSSWLEKCSGPVSRKKSAKVNLFPDFPGFDEGTCFRSKVVLDSSLTHRVLGKDFAPKDGWDYEKKIRHASEYFSSCIEQLAEKSPDVVLTWLERKATQHGFSVQAEKVRTVPRPRQYFIKSGKAGLHCATEFTGVLSVTDVQAFREAFSKGIGSAKAFGFGLLCLSPLS